MNRKLPADLRRRLLRHPDEDVREHASQSAAERVRGRGPAEAELTMLAKRLIPCLDVDRGRVVKGVQFASLRDAGDPMECAVRYDAEGADELAFLDINASADARPIVLDMVRRVADSVFLPFTVGGGVRSVEDADALLRAGADKVAVNTAAVRDPALLDRLAQRFGSQAVVLAIDARVARSDEAGQRRPALGGPQPRRADAYGTGCRGLGREGAERGAGEVLLTSMDRDGTRAGFDVALTRAVSDAVRIPVVASGGCGSVEHMVEVLTEGAPARRWPRRSSTSGRSACARPRPASERRASRCAHEPPEPP
jgi:cyclase